MNLYQTTRTINGEGKPRILVTKPQHTWASFGTTTYSATTATEAMGATGAITSSSNVTDAIYQVGHGFATGDRIRIAGHSGSTPDLNGDWTVAQVIDADHYDVGRVITTGGTGGTARKLPDFTGIRAGMRIVASTTRSGYAAKIVYGRITSVDRTNFVITLAEGWVGGIPTNGNSYQVNGYVVDLPYCFELTEIFVPDQELHELWRGRVEVAEWFGWGYRAALDYSKHIRVDALQAMRPILNRGKGDGLILIPHVDKPQYNYGVIYDGEIALSRYGVSGGHRKFALGFRGTQLVATWPMSGNTGWGHAWGRTFGKSSD